MNRLRILAFYLPQFHATEENDLWWGKDYTDWVATRKAKPLFNNHYQPRIPFNNNYYDLKDVNVMRQQAEMAREYGIDGFCIYHYYSNGKLMLEKPIENLRDEKTIDISYCLSWGNHDFRKNWFGGDKSLLRAQTYGGEDDYLKHIQYLITFFEDPRYLKMGNKPVFVIYDVMAIEEYEKMIAVWNEQLKKVGFDGVHIIAMKCRPNVKVSALLEYDSVESVIPFEPLNIRSNSANGNPIYIFFRRLRTVFLRMLDKYFHITLPERYDYTWANKQMLKSSVYEKQCYCIFPDWDNTPRYGARSVVFKNSSPALFYKFSKLFIERSKKENSPFLFINAWNEWGESAYLEPDEKNEYAYLEALNNAIRASE